MLVGRNTYTYAHHTHTRTHIDRHTTYFATSLLKFLRSFAHTLLSKTPVQETNIRKGIGKGREEKKRLKHERKSFMILFCPDTVHTDITSCFQQLFAVPQKTPMGEGPRNSILLKCIQKNQVVFLRRYIYMCEYVGAYLGSISDRYVCLLYVCARLCLSVIHKRGTLLQYFTKFAASARCTRTLGRSRKPNQRWLSSNYQRNISEMKQGNIREIDEKERREIDRERNKQMRHEQ